MLPHALLHLLSERNRELLDLRAGDIYLTELPLFHINAQMSVYSALLVGARVRIEQRFSAVGLARPGAGERRHPHVAARRHALVHPQAAGTAGGLRQRAPARLVGAVPARPRGHLPRALRAGGGRHLLREHGDRDGRPPHPGRATGLRREGRPRPLRREDRGRRRRGRARRRGRGAARAPRAPVDDDHGVLRDARAHARGVPEPLVPHRRRGAARRRREPLVRRPDQGPDPPAGREHRLCRRRERPPRAPRRSPTPRLSPSRPTSRAARTRSRRSSSPRPARRSTRRPSGRGATSPSPTSRCRATWRSCPSCRRPRRRKCASPSCGRPGSRPRRATAAPRAAAGAVRSGRARPRRRPRQRCPRRGSRPRRPPRARRRSRRRRAPFWRGSRGRRSGTRPR